MPNRAGTRNARNGGASSYSHVNAAPFKPSEASNATSAREPAAARCEGRRRSATARQHQRRPAREQLPLGVSWSGASARPVQRVHFVDARVVARNRAEPAGPIAGRSPTISRAVQYGREYRREDRRCDEHGDAERRARERGSEVPRESNDSAVTSEPDGEVRPEIERPHAFGATRERRARRRRARARLERAQENNSASGIRNSPCISRWLYVENRYG